MAAYSYSAQNVGSVRQLDGPKSECTISERRVLRVMNTRYFLSPMIPRIKAEYTVVGTSHGLKLLNFAMRRTLMASCRSFLQ